MKLLHVNASPRGAQSRTLEISKEFTSTLKARYPDLEIKELDLNKIELPKVVGGAVDAKYAIMQGGAPSEDARSTWEEIVALASDFVNHDMYLISSPMWNFSIPYRLKQYIDIIMQAGILFNFTENGVEGLAKGKKMFCITTRGSNYAKGSPMEQFDFIEPYLRSIFGFAGIYDITFVNAQPLDYAPGITQSSMQLAKHEAQQMAASI